MGNEEIHKIIVGLVLVTVALKTSECYPRKEQVNRQHFEISANFDRKSRKSYTKQNQNQCQKFPSDCGIGINCGRDNSTQVWWYPRVVDPRRPLTVYLDFKLPVIVHNLTATLDVHIFEEKNPIFTIIQTATCEQLKEFLKEYAPFSINCPLQKNVPLKTSLPLSSLSRLPTGNFTIKTNVTNESNHTVFCVKTSFEIRKNQE